MKAENLLEICIPAAFGRKRNPSSLLAFRKGAIFFRPGKVSEPQDASSSSLEKRMRSVDVLTENEEKSERKGGGGCGLCLARAHIYCTDN